MGRGGTTSSSWWGNYLQLEVLVDVVEHEGDVPARRRDGDARGCSNDDGWAVDRTWFGVRVLVEKRRAVHSTASDLERKVGADSPRVARHVLVGKADSCTARFTLSE